MSDEYNAVIYWSKTDKCWIAHSLYTDQVGTGARVMNALADLIQAIKSIGEVAKEDSSVAYFRRAPGKILRMAETAKPLPGECFEVAYRMVHDDWPETVAVDVDPDRKARPRYKANLELTVA